ncbi:MAG: hypothetical protein RBR97_15615 [Bacteroidales bacterium]|nr:hypothetical protein [Bacteroidales bacterium]
MFNNIQTPYNELPNKGGIFGVCFCSLATTEKDRRAATKSDHIKLTKTKYEFPN